MTTRVLYIFFMTSSISDMDFFSHTSQVHWASLISCVQQPVRPVATLVDGAGFQDEGKDEADFTPQEGAGITTCGTEQRTAEKQKRALGNPDLKTTLLPGFSATRVSNFLIASACWSCAFSATPSGLAVNPTSVWWSGRVTPLKRASWLLRGFSLIWWGALPLSEKRKPNSEIQIRSGDL